MKTRLEAFCLAPLTACISSLFGLAAATPVWASTTHTINSCDDGVSAATTPGTLRYEILHAAPTDAIDVTAIPTVCGTSYITLYSGEIPVTQSTLAIYGSGKEAIRTIFGRLFKHSGTGTLSISDLTIESGEYLSSYSNKNADGGCIYSAGNVTLTNTSVIDCLAWLYKPTSGSPQARGGAIFAKGNVTLTGSKVSGNVADAVYDSLNSPAFETIGGGVYAASVTTNYSTIAGNTASAQFGSLAGGIFTTGGLSATHSTIADNTAYSVQASASKGGGAYVAGALTLVSSTVSNNRSEITGGIIQSGSGFYCTITNSTISGNVSYIQIGGMNLNSSAAISNSTIVFNKGFGVGGVFAHGPILTLRSSIFADNQGGASAVDLTLDGAVTVSGEANLVMSTNADHASAGITLSSEPHLAPLANHGGPTLTHALLANSPAVAAGSNPGGYPYDQRGPGFDRTLSIPPPAALTWTDIGAYQRQLVDDEIFYDGFGLLPGG
jgi:hypothetical protein